MRIFYGLTKQSSFRDTTDGFLAKYLLRNERRDSIPMTRHYQDLSSATDWMKQILNQSEALWNFCARFSDVISRGNQWWHCENSG